jgi:hypothetical protein
MVTLKLKGLDTCTVTLVAPDIILTASHCVPWENLDTEKRFTGNCWIRFPQSLSSSLASSPEVACGTLISASRLGQDVGSRIYPDHAFIRLSKAISDRRPLSILPIPLAQSVNSASSLLFGVHTSTTEHSIVLLQCDRDDTYQIPKVAVTRGEAIIFPSCHVRHGYSGGPILDPNSLKIIGVISGVIGFDPNQPERPLPSIGTVVSPL